MLRTPPAYIALVDFPLTAQQVRIELKIALFLILVFCAMHLGVVVCKVGKTDGLVCAIGGTFLFPGSRLLLADICAQGTQL